MILTLYILRYHFAPFIFSAVTLFFILVLQFLMKFAERLVGKGLDTWVVIQLILYNLAWMMVLVIPMSVLASTIMAYGALSQNNEITVMKSAGISLYRMIAGPLIISFGIAYLLVLFNNDVLPDANHKAKTLLQDISSKKPTLSLVPNIFSQEVTNYAILARRIDPKTSELYDLTIYDYNNPVRVNVVTANKGRLYFSKDQSKLIMDLSDGEIHESDVVNRKLYRRIKFEDHRIMMNAYQFSFQQTTPGGTRGDRELSSSNMMRRVDSLEVISVNHYNYLIGESAKFFTGDSSAKPLGDDKEFQSNPNYRYSQIIARVKGVKNTIVSAHLRYDFISKEINKYMVEIHKKYAIPVACIIFIILGAPLGVMTRKGGFGIAASISLFFFVIYWAFLIGGEKLADRGLISPFAGMWAANILLGSLGVFLLIRSAKETVTINFSFLQKLIPKNWRNIKQETNENN